VRRKLDGVRVLAKGELTAKLTLKSPARRRRPSRRSRRPAARSLVDGHGAAAAAE
jgi:hypothetical protein